jgi:hypothetical protein
MRLAMAVELRQVPQRPLLHQADASDISRALNARSAAQVCVSPV